MRNFLSFVFALTVHAIFFIALGYAFSNKETQTIDSQVLMHWEWSLDTMTKDDFSSASSSVSTEPEPKPEPKPLFNNIANSNADLLNPAKIKTIEQNNSNTSSKNSKAVENTASQANTNIGGQHASAQNKSKTNHSELNAYKSSLSLLIERNKFYPKREERMGITGTIKMRITILANGQFSNIQIISSSGNRNLDNAAKSIINKIGKFKPTPTGQPLTVTIPVEFNVR